MKIKHYSELIGVVTLAPAVIIGWYCSKRCKALLGENPRLARRGPLLVLRLLARDSSMREVAPFIAGIYLFGALVGAVGFGISGALAGVASVLGFFSLLPFLFPAPSVLVGSN